MKNETLQTPPELLVTDIYLPLNHLFNSAAKRAFQNKIELLKQERFSINSPFEKVVDEVRFFGCKAVGERKIFDAAQNVANEVNFYANLGFVTGAMTKLLLYKLFSEPFQLEQWVVLSYIALSPEGLEYLKNNPSKIEMEIGGTIPITPRE